jgi:hypothetical protein
VGGGVKGILAEVFVQMKLPVPSGCNFQGLHRQPQTQRANFVVRLFRALSLTSFAAMTEADVGKGMGSVNRFKRI